LEATEESLEYFSEGWGMGDPGHVCPIIGNWWSFPKMSGRRNDLRTIVVIGARTKNGVGKLSIAMFFPCLPVFFLPCSHVRPVLAWYSGLDPTGFIAEK